MRVKTVFAAYPYSFGPTYRESIASRFAGSEIEIRYADDRIENAHVMEKIRRMISDCDVAFFDVTNNNPNVMFELGYALGANEPGFVVVQQDAVNSISADITGWDQLRYSDYGDLAEKLHQRITTARVPQRMLIPAKQTYLDPKQTLQALHFGIPEIDDATLCVYAVPVAYQRYNKERSLLGTPPYRPQDLCDAVLAGPNATQHTTFFWAGGFDYPKGITGDFLEVYDSRTGRQRDRMTNFRMYLSGAATYMQRLREGSSNTPFLYLYMFQEIAEMALIAIHAAREKLNFEEQDLAVGTVLLRASDARISTATPSFYPAGDAGHTLARPSDVLWVPEEPIITPSDDLSEKAKELASEMAAEFRALLD